MLLVLFIGALTAAAIYLSRLIAGSDRKIIHLHFIAIFLGLIFEFIRISRSLQTVLGTAAGSFILSMLAFSRRKGEVMYVFKDHLEHWPYFFLGAFIFIATAVQYSKATLKMTEGITLLLTMAINYWIIANGYWTLGSLLVKVLIVINCLLSIFSIYQALSYRVLNKATILILSIWSSIIVLVLALNNFLVLFNYQDIDNSASFSDTLLIFLEFFLMGVSGIYVAQNLTMIGAYLPGKNYLETIREINDVHLNRFSKEQVYIVDSLLVIILSLTLFVLNYYLQFFPVNVIIWITITVTPLLLYLVRKILD